MQTIKVTVKTNEAKTATVFCTDSGAIASVSPDVRNKGKFTGHFAAYGNCDNSTFADAVEFISDAITNHFAAFGLNVEFN